MDPITIVCIASYEKGHEFIRECQRQGVRVILLTSKSLEHTAHFPFESIHETFYIPDEGKKWNPQHTLNSLAYWARTRPIDRIVPLDDFDLEMAAFLREHFRIAGMGESTTRYFRDKLAMRMRAREAGIPIPAFTPVLLHIHLTEFLQQVPGPWVLKPRSSAGAIGIHKVHDVNQLWSLVHGLGDLQSYYLVEQFVPGDVYHVDSIVIDDEVRLAVASKYGRPPLEVSQEGGIFTTTLVERGTDLERRLLDTNRRVLQTLGLHRGVSHSEYIVSHETGEVLFLETSARVGGAHIADLIEAATGINFWAEWAKIEIAGRDGDYTRPEARQDYAGLIVSLARVETPDLSSFDDPEIVWRMDKPHHVGLIVRSPDRGRVNQLLDAYTDRIRRDFHASAPPHLDRPTE